MAKKPGEKIILAEHVLEVRHVASGSFLDVRGYVADYIRGSGLFPHWKIDSNIVNFRDAADKVEREGAFVSYKNAGYLVFNPDTRNYFVDRASAFWKALLKNQHYKIPDIIRFGARTKAFLPTAADFEEMNHLVFESFFTEKATTMIGGKQTDVQFIIEIRDASFEARIAGGPMHADEVKKFMGFDSEEFSKCGVYLDIDYYKKKDVGHDHVPRLLKQAVELTWSRVESIAAGLGI